jgi:hypothetical protein
VSVFRIGRSYEAADHTAPHEKRGLVGTAKPALLRDQTHRFAVAGSPPEQQTLVEIADLDWNQAESDERQRAPVPDVRQIDPETFTVGELDRRELRRDAGRARVGMFVTAGV